MNKIFLLAFFFILLFIKTRAQDNLLPGYILRDQFDTVSGFIDDKNYYLNSIYCDFKAVHSDSLERYFPRDVYGYRFTDGKYYISKEVKIAGKDSVIFLEFLIHGKLDFYFMQDQGRTNHYYASDSVSPMLELLSSKEIVQKDGKNYLIENKQYISMLEFFTRDYPELVKEIVYMDEPNHRNLIDLGETYHHHVCEDWDCIIYHKKMKYKFVVEAAGGYKLFSHQVNEYYRSPGNPFVGVRFYVNNPRFSERSYFGTGFIYEDVSVIDSSGVKTQNFKIPFTYSYSSPKKGISPVVFAGMNLRTYEGALFTSVSVSPGLKYNFKSFFLNLYIEFEFGSLIVIPVMYHSTNFGLGINYKFD
jgi:hypothetical protein